MNLKTLIGAALVAGVAFVAGTASATVYRAGLAGGYINSYDSGKYTTAEIPDIGVFNGPAAARESSNGDSKTSYPPTWVNNRTWCYHGQMYFDGGTYYFGKNIDDATFIKVNGEQKLKNEEWNSFKVTPAIKLEAGWYDVEFRMGNGTGGAGCSNGTKGRDGNPLGLGYIHYAADAESTPAPTKMEELDYPSDPGDGSVLRLVDESADYIKVNSIEKVDGGYSFNITSLAPSPSTVTVFADASSDPETWDLSGSEEFAANETKDVFVPYTLESKPYYIVKLAGVGTTLAEGEGVAFWQWSDVGKCTMEPTVSPVIGAVTTSSASFEVTLGYKTVIIGMEPPLMALKAYYGATDAGAGGTWDATADFGDENAAGSYSCALENLDVGKTYYVRFAAKTEESDWIWSDCLAFSTSGPSLEAPASVCENDPTEQAFKVLRPSASAAEPLTVYLSYSGATDKVTQLPASVTFDAGVSEVRVPFKTIDDDQSTGDATLTLTINEDPSYVLGDPYTVDILILDDEASADEITWTGANGDNKWETAGNWEPARVPTAMDTVVFTDTGLASGGTVTIDSEATCRILKISRLDAMTLGGTGSLKLGGVTRADIEGNEADHQIDVTLKFFPIDGMNFNCFVAGSGALRLNQQAQRALDGTEFVKTGSGALYLMKQDTVPNGSLTILAGEVRPMVDRAARGDIVIGGGDETALFLDPSKYAHELSPYVYSNGTFRSTNENLDGGGADNYNIHEGGYAEVKSIYGGKIDLWGAPMKITYRFWSGCYTQHITAHQSDLMARLDGALTCSDYYDYSVKVENGAQPIDFIFNGAIDGGGTGHNFTVSGNGTMQTLAGWGTPRNVTMSDITWLMDNVGGDKGSGSGNLTVGNSATVGGLGVWGGGAESQILKFQGSSGKVATLAPGSLTTDGDHVTGTYTVGKDGVTNTLNMAAYSRMLVRVAEEKQDGKTVTIVDGLKVYGTMNVADANTAIAVELADPEQNIRDLKGGEFVIAEATDAINGTFADVQVPAGAKWKVRYEGKKIILSIPARGFAVFVK